MNQGPTNPFLERQWREEVRYLHSLWHYGNSSSNANPNPNPILQYQPRPHFIINNNSNSNNLRASNFTSFKRENSKKKKKTKNQGRKSSKNNTINVNPNPTDTSGIEWPCEPSPEPQKSTGWPQPSSHSNATATTRSISPEELAKYDALQLQQKSLRASQDFFARNLDSDGDNGEEDSEVEEEEQEEAKNDDNEEYQFFLGIFKEDNELRRYYEKNYESGEFCCLVCAGMRKKLGKRFKNCVALVQHSTGICNTDRKKAHRAFAQVVCYVLGWDIKRLPSIVLSTSEPLGRVLAQGQGQDQEGTTEENDKLLDSGDNAGSDNKEDGQDRVVESEGTDKVDLKDGQGVFR